MMGEIFLILFGLSLVAFTWYAHDRLVAALEKGGTPLRLRSYPSVTVIRPIRGLDAGAEGNIAAALDNGYPGEVETIFVFDDANEPALPLVEQAIDMHLADGRPGTARVLFCGSPPPGQTGKLNAMIKGLNHAKGELIAFADSDIRPDRDALRVLVETLMTSPGAGSSFAPVVVSENARTAGDVGYGVMLNGLYGPEAAASTVRHHGTLPFIMGQFMLFKRSTIDAIGGLESAEGQFVDDVRTSEGRGDGF